MSMAAGEAMLGGHYVGQVHILPVRIYYEDTDFSGMVYHANYLRYFERGRSDALRLAGVHHAALWEREESLAFTVQRMDIEFIQPGRIDDLLEVRTVFLKTSGARVKARQAILRDEQEIARARVFAACINHEGRPRRVPAEMAAAMAPYMIDDDGF